MSKYLMLAATSDIGRATVQLLQRNDHTLFLTGRSEQDIVRFAEAQGSSYAVLDLTDFGATENVFKLAADKLGGLDGVVNFAGSLQLQAAHRTSRQQYEDTVGSSLTTAFSAVRAAGQIMTKTGGSVVLISSAAALCGLANHEAIAAAKAGVIGLTLSAAATYANRNLRFNAVAPGLTKTRATKLLTENSGSRRLSEAMHALGRLGEPEDIARAIAFLLAPANSWITGQVIAVDGGLCCLHPRPKI